MIEAATEGGAGDEPFEVLEENAEAVELFLAVCGQWRVAPMGGVLGLDWQFVSLELQFRDTPSRKGWAGLKIMERTARKVLNERNR